jgi:hypothetical protein
MAKSEENKFVDKRAPTSKEGEKSTSKPPAMEQPGRNQASQPLEPPYEPTELVIKEIMVQKNMTREEALAHLKSSKQ